MSASKEICKVVIDPLTLRLDGDRGAQSPFAARGVHAWGGYAEYFKARLVIPAKSGIRESQRLAVSPRSRG